MMTKTRNEIKDKSPSTLSANQELECSYTWPVHGLAYFLSHPRLWKGPLLTVMLALLVMASIFFLLIFYNWPESNLPWTLYLWTIVKSVGYGFAAILAVWVVALPLGLSWCFEGMIRKIYQEQEVQVVEESLLHSIKSGLHVLWKTLGWRIFWPLFTLLCTFMLGPIGVIVGHVGLGHITAMDATDLSLSLIGYKSSQRLELLKKNRSTVFFSGVAGGLTGFLLGLTVIAWLFWLPGVFAGAPLWLKNLGIPKKAKKI